jgi:hypothetical protein
MIRFRHCLPTVIATHRKPFKLLQLLRAVAIPLIERKTKGINALHEKPLQSLNYINHFLIC